MRKEKELNKINRIAKTLQLGQKVDGYSRFGERRKFECPQLVIGLLIWSIVLLFTGRKVLAEEVPAIGSVREVTLGRYHSCAITTNDDLYCWGKNSSGAVGNGTDIDVAKPVKVLENVSTVSLSKEVDNAIYDDNNTHEHTCAITKAGALYCWGRNDFGQVGNNSTSDRLTPVKVKDGIAAVSLGWGHTCAVGVEGAVYCWGNNEKGQVGNGNTSNQKKPVKVKDGIKAISTGYYNTCGVSVEDDLYCWGFNERGQIGNGSTSDQKTPVKVMDGIATVSLSWGHTCSVSVDGGLYCWGSNAEGQLGKEVGVTNQLTPVKVMDAIKAVTLGIYHTCSISNEGSLYCFGRNDYGQVGNGSTGFQMTPTKLMDGIAAVTLGLYHTCGMGVDGAMYCWGYNEQGQIGNGSTIDQLTPVKVMDDIATISTGDFHTCSVSVDGSLSCWGDNDYRQVGNNSTSNRFTPTIVMGGIEAISLGWGHTCGVSAEGGLYCWGYNGQGQVGNGSTIDQNTPVKVMDGIKAVSCGYYHTCSVSTEGGLYCWGANWHGQVGNDSTSNQLTPVKIMDGIKAVNSGRYHSCALTDEGALYCWGANWIGQVGDNSTSNRLSPVKIMDGIKTTSLVLNHTCAVSTDDGLYCWGYNGQGQIGNNKTSTQKTPVRVMDDIKAVTVGLNHTCAVSVGGSLYCWGKNDYRQVGNNSSSNQKLPVELMDGIDAVSSGVYHTCAVGVDGSLYCWGKNDYGQVGNNSTSTQPSPVKVMDDITSVTLGEYHTCAVSTDGGLHCFGRNDYGQVGSADTGKQKTPIKVMDGVSTVSISMGNTPYIHTCAVKTNKELYCFGSNVGGKLGIGGINEEKTPQDIFDGSGSAPIFCDDCCYSFKYGEVGETCTNGLSDGCGRSGEYQCYKNGKRQAVVCNAGARACCADTLYTSIDEICSGGYGICQTNGTYYCSGTALNSSVVCDSEGDISLAEDETCNELDDDCDGSVDEDFTDKGEACTVGVGACANNGTYVCKADGSGTECNAVEGTPSAEKCDEVDHDCDGNNYNGFDDLNEECTVGVGACASNGTYVCKADGSGTECNAVEGTPTAEKCDEVDHDCDGDNYNGFNDLNEECTVGVGACANNGTYVCKADGSGTECNAVEGTPTAEKCDEVDHDCDGNNYNGFDDLNEECTVGVGACANTGTYVCKADGSGTECSAVEGTPTAEKCDEVDHDCDGNNYNGFDVLNEECTVGVGACANNGTYVCKADGSGTECSVQPLDVAVQEICGDGIDNDCDGEVDNGCATCDYDPLKDRIGEACNTGGEGVCNAGTYICENYVIICKPNITASAELCDGLDNDCDGEVDEDFTGLGSKCSRGSEDCKVEGIFVCGENNEVVCNAFKSEECERRTKDTDNNGIPDAYESETENEVVVRPNTKLLPPFITTDKRRVDIRLEKFTAGSLNEYVIQSKESLADETKGVKWVYKVRISRRNSITSMRAVSYRYSKTNQIKFRRKKWENYRISYRVIIKKGKVVKRTARSKKIIISGRTARLAH